MIRHKDIRMRRSEKEITDRAEIGAIIRGAKVCRLGLCDDGEPYIVPMCFGYDGEYLYFHSAVEGRKLDILRRQPRVCIEIDEMLAMVEADSACRWSMSYRSVMGLGTVEFLENLAAKRAGLAVVMAQYATGEFTFPDQAVDRVCVFRVRVDELTGKRSE
jgi:nitroimidazol reductase NimA-like FMN-containing flavoprotein (pyridoxamine 5'-phosphate oxidase superfamily)